jgi:hypothetical protein
MGAHLVHAGAAGTAGEEEGAPARMHLHSLTGFSILHPVRVGDGVVLEGPGAQPWHIDEGVDVGGAAPEVALTRVGLAAYTAQSRAD